MIGGVGTAAEGDDGREAGAEETKRVMRASISA